MQTIQAINIISEIQKTVSTIKLDWSIIRANIDHDTTSKCDYDLPNVLKDIDSLTMKVIKYKLMQVCINIGFTTVEQMPKNSIYSTIFTLSEKESQARELRTLLARKKRVGKHIEALLSDETLQKRLKSTEDEINNLKTKLTDFNEHKTLVGNVA